MLDLQQEGSEAGEVDETVVNTIEDISSDVANLTEDTKLSLFSTLGTIADREENTDTGTGEDVDFDAGVDPSTGATMVEVGISLMGTFAAGDIDASISELFLAIIRTGMTTAIKQDSVGGEGFQCSSSSSPAFAAKVDPQTVQTAPIELSVDIQIVFNIFSFATRRALFDGNLCTSTMSQRMYALDKAFFAEFVGQDITSDQVLTIELVCDENGEVISNITFDEDLEFTLADFVTDLPPDTITDQDGNVCPFLGFACAFMDNGTPSQEGMETVSQSDVEIVCKTSHLSEFVVEPVYAAGEVTSSTTSTTTSSSSSSSTEEEELVLIAESSGSEEEILSSLGKILKC